MKKKPLALTATWRQEILKKAKQPDIFSSKLESVCILYIVSTAYEQN